LLQVFTIDDLFAATARVEVSADDVAFTLVAASISDANGTASGGFHPFAAVPVAVAFRYVRLTDLGTSPHPFEDLGFDLDAVGRESAGAVPEPGGLALLCLGVLGLAGHTWRRRATPAWC
jgi:hypothetical protein